LSSIKMTLSAVDKEALTPINQKIIESAYNASDSSIVALKEIANSLSPHLLKNYGLEKSVKTLADQLFSVGNISFQTDFNLEEDHLSEEMKISCYRIISELMNNSVKHANPSLVYLGINESNGILRMKYKDDGSGFENYLTGKDSKARGMGFNNILSRIKSLKGMYQIKTSPGKGFSIEFHFPLP
jgi:signal transduction histidine kinase